MIGELTTNKLTYNKKTKTFSCYASECISGGIAESYSVTNPKTKESRLFNQTHVDTDGSGEDVYGWNYKTQCGIKLLIIND
jgi:hypothetical protein